MGRRHGVTRTQLHAHHNGRDIDLLGELTYGSTYEKLLPDTVIVAAFGIECRCLTLERLIEVKRAVGRIKDLEAIAELEVIAEERRRLADGS